MKILSGKIIKGNGAASQRFKECRHVLNNFGLLFPPLHFGTINIKIEEKYITPYYGIIIPYHLLDEISKNNKEYWQFIPVNKVNGKNIIGYILRTSINIHGENVVELITEYMPDNAKDNTTITIELYE